MYALCQDIWDHLNQTPLKPLPDHLLSVQKYFATSSVQDFFTKNASTRTIDLKAVSDADAAYLASLGISQPHLVRNLKETLNDRHLDPLGFQLNAVRDKSVSAFCPFGGKRVVSNQSFLANINVIFYRFESEQVFYVATAGIGSGFRKSALYFPENDLVITAGDSWGFQQADLLELKARMVCGAQACYDYLSDPDQKSRKSAVCLGFYHFAHHLWNELSGLHRLYRKHLLSSVDRFLVLREPLGPIEQIFPEIPADRIERKDSTSDLFYEILTQGYFAVRVGDDYLARDLASRIAKISAANCSSGTLEKVKETSSKYRPLLWVGIRVGNRAWADQVHGLSNVIASLHEEFPALGVVFDGFSLPADRSAQLSDEQGYSTILAQENEIVSSIVGNLQRRQVQVGIFNIIGLSIFDANVWAHAIDVYVSPHGSLQHKVGWFTNKHGIVHTNQTLLQKPAKYIWEAVENGIPPRYIDSASVTDIHSESGERIFYNEISDASEIGAGTQAANEKVRQNAEFTNYSVQWKALHSDLVDLIRSPKVKGRMAAFILAHRVRRRVRLTARTLVNVLK
jgi:hypothetical protein